MNKCMLSSFMCQWSQVGVKPVLSLLMLNVKLFVFTA